jgi:hypothetical protein
MGFIVYYLIPYTFTFNDFKLFFFILTIILLGTLFSNYVPFTTIGMLFGLSLIGVTLQHLLEKLFVYVIMWGEDYWYSHLLISIVVAIVNAIVVACHYKLSLTVANAAQEYVSHCS